MLSGLSLTASNLIEPLGEVRIVRSVRWGRHSQQHIKYFGSQRVVVFDEMFALPEWKGHPLQGPISDTVEVHAQERNIVIWEMELPPAIDSPLRSTDFCLHLYLPSMDSELVSITLGQLTAQTRCTCTNITSGGMEVA